MNSSPGHRERLRRRFQTNASQLSAAEQLELLLTYAIPRQDVAPLAQALLAHFGSLDQVLAASTTELQQVKGVGETTAVLIQLVTHLNYKDNPLHDDEPGGTLNSSQLSLFEEPLLPAPTAPPGSPVVSNAKLHAFVNDEITTALEFLPQASAFATYTAFKSFLIERLPYNSTSTRQRRAQHILARFYPDETLDVALTDYTSRLLYPADLYPVIFYHILQAEPLAAQVADELIWPALPTGYVTREDMRLFVLRSLPDLSASSQKNVLRSLFNLYDLLQVGVKEDSLLRLRVRQGTLPAFLYILTAVYHQPGIYTFDALEQGPLRRWLLWEREWLRRQLYNLRDFGIISKISEIDTVRQFTLAFDQRAALQHYFEHPHRHEIVLRETAVTETTTP